MHQLDLFGYRAPAALEASVPPPLPAQAEDPLLPAKLSEGLPGQLGLFADRNLRLARARAAIAEGQLAEGCGVFAGLLERYPTDRVVQHEAAHAAHLHDRIARVEALVQEARAPWLLAMARELEGSSEHWAQLRGCLLRRVAEELGHAGGEARELEGQPPGYYLLEAGAFVDARASLTSAVAVRRSARYSFLLGDAATALGDERAARRAYLEAVLLDPFDEAFGKVRDVAVRGLPDVARYELEVEDEPAAWAAPVGILMGVLPAPADDLVGRHFAEEVVPRLSAARHDALVRARAFAAALCAAKAQARGPDARIEARRAMKRSSPRLFEAYMDRVVRGRAG